VAKKTHSVYVIELKRSVLKNKKFATANPHFSGEKPCVYIGMTGLTPEERFEQHLSGYKAARIAKRFGVRLKPRLYASKNPMTYEDACAMEVELARRLRNRGYAVWQN